MSPDIVVLVTQSVQATLQAPFRRQLGLLCCPVLPPLQVPRVVLLLRFVFPALSFSAAKAAVQQVKLHVVPLLLLCLLLCHSTSTAPQPVLVCSMA